MIDARRRRHTTMVNPAEFREIMAARSEGRALSFTYLIPHGTLGASGSERRVSVLLADDEVERLQQARMGAIAISR